jgi:hypothetical protein
MKEQSVDQVRFCPRCGSAAVNYSVLEGSLAECSGCQWSGGRDQLLVVPITHDFINDEDMLRSMMQDMRALLSGSLGVPYLKFLTKWGFVGTDKNGKADVRAFSKYLATIAAAILNAILSERARQEQEQVGQRLKEGSSGN